jgi:hypothetical protein
VSEGSKERYFGVAIVDPTVEPFQVGRRCLLVYAYVEPASSALKEFLIASDPERHFRPPYVGHRGWLGVYLDVPVDWEDVAGWWPTLIVLSLRDNWWRGSKLSCPHRGLHWT